MKSHDIAGIPAKKGGKRYPSTVYSVRSYARLANREDWSMGNLLRPLAREPPVPEPSPSVLANSPSEKA
jgi:hypothetical protein